MIKFNQLNVQSLSTIVISYSLSILIEEDLSVTITTTFLFFLLIINLLMILKFLYHIIIAIKYSHLDFIISINCRIVRKFPKLKTFL